jgi:phosphoserine phosphatase
MLGTVGHRVAVNPSSRLRRIARTEGWQSCDWDEPVVASAYEVAQRLTPRAAR